MDALIEAFLVDTGAVRPLPNPQFDPAKYRPELEGKAKLKGGGAAANRRPKVPRGKPVAGWQPLGTCRIAWKEGTLVITSSGGDPHVSCSLPKPVSPQALTLRFKLNSNSSGNGQVFWHEQGVAPAYFRERSVNFDVQHDGADHEYAVEFTAKNPVQGIRIDPSRGSGIIRLSEIRLTTPAGEVLHRFAPVGSCSTRVAKDSRFHSRANTE